MLASAIWQEKEIKGIQVRRKKIKPSVFADDVIIYIENLKESTKNLLGLISGFSKVTGYKVNIQNSIMFICIRTRKNPTEILRCKPKKMCAKSICQTLQKSHEKSDKT